MQVGTVDLDKLRGVSDKFVGLTKETLGVLINNSSLQRAGEAQQEKATEMLKALRDEAAAEAKEAEAAALHKTDPGSSGSGVVAEVKGKVKQAAGDLSGNPDLEKSGQTDEARGRAQREATQDRVTAKAHEVKSRMAGKAQDATED